MTDERAYEEMIGSLRELLDDIAAARPDDSTVASMTHSFRDWSRELSPMAVDEADQLFARGTGPGRGQSTVPVFVPEVSADDHVAGTVRFGRAFLGGRGAVHGGAIAALFDEVLGFLANAGGRRLCRTAYLKVDFRSIVPVERELRVTAHFTSETGRKRYLVGELRDGDVVCAEADGLFVELKPGQP